MPAFKDIVGHEQIIEHLQNAITMDKVSHAYILNGPDKSGKMMIAEAFAQTLQCEAVNKKLEELAGETESERIENKFTAEPCMECHSCKQAAGKNQPDIIYVSHEKPNTISVDDIRTQLNNDIVIKPYSSKHKIYIVDEAEKMNQQAQNALLKTIEEPPAYAVILLLTINAESFLPTILSRCVTLNLKAVPDEKIKKFLHQKCPVSKQAVSSNCIFYHSVLISKFTCMRKPGEHIAAWQKRILIKESHTSPQNTSHKQCQLYKVFFLFVSKYSTKHRCHQQEQTDHGIFHNRPITLRQ